MIEKHNTVSLIIALLVAMASAAIGGQIWGGANTAVCLALAVAALGSLLFVSYVGLVRLLTNHLRHLIEASILTIKHPGIGSTSPPKEAEKAMKEVKKDFARANELVSKK